MTTLFQELQQQRWDDHRFYHQSRINQALHLVSALSFLTAYVFLVINPVVSAALGWVVAMVTRQSGHFFFEPRDYDRINRVTHDYKEEVKVGYNLRRKVVLLSIWALSPLFLWLNPSMFGVLTPAADSYGYIYNLSLLWITLGAVALLFRTVHLFFLRDIRTGLTWCLKIITDPFHDVKLYYRSPFYLLRGQLIDPMPEVCARQDLKENPGLAQPRETAL